MPLDFTGSQSILVRLQGPKWRNWQTRMVQGHVPARVWGFKSPLRHHGSLTKRRTQCTRSARTSAGVFREYRSGLLRRLRDRLRSLHPVHERAAVPARPIRNEARVDAEDHLKTRMPQHRRHPANPDPLIPRPRPQITPDHTDALAIQQLELWPDL